MNSKTVCPTILIAARERAEGIMLFGSPIDQLGVLVGLLVCGGVVTGMLAGLFGIGGGAIVVPVLYELFRIMQVPEAVRFQLCLGTSFAIILPTTVRSYLTHRARGAALDDVLRKWALPSQPWLQDTAHSLRMRCRKEIWKSHSDCSWSRSQYGSSSVFSDVWGVPMTGLGQRTARAAIDPMMMRDFRRVPGPCAPGHQHPAQC
jgi:hypothetical protein